MCTMDTMDNESVHWIVAKEEAFIIKSFGQNIVTRPVITPRKTYFPVHMEALKIPNDLEDTKNDKSARHMKTLIIPDWIGKQRN